MKVAIIGSGGREHALAYKIKQSELLSDLFILPGNPGTENLGTNINISSEDKKSILEFCLNNKIDLVVIGAEQPLVDGLSDLLRNNGLLVFGPSQSASAIEGDKAFSKNLMKQFNIPTAAFKTFYKEDYQKCINYLKTIEYPTVIKASGLAAGKGVIICANFAEANKTVEDIFKNNQFGDSGNQVVIEEFMAGLEASIFAVTDGDDFVTLPAAQDHKRIYNNDEGKNTGGMGAYAPAPLITNELLEEIEEKIIKQTLNALSAIGRKYNGCLYAGIMITKEGPKVVEFNCRFGDPETQVVLPIIEGDFLKLIYSTAKGKVDKTSVKYSGACAVCVIAASGGYPDGYKKGIVISGLDKITSENTIVFHAGTRKNNGDIVTSGGRVIGVTSVNKYGDLSDCKKETYNEISKINYSGMHYRTDISDKASLKV